MADQAHNSSESIRNPASVGVIIVNYKTAQLTCRAIESLYHERQNYLPNLYVAVVDNDSPDDSHNVLTAFVAEKQWQDWVFVKKAEKNGGYAYGNNQGFALLKEHAPELAYFWWLNPDTYIRPEAGKVLVEFLTQNPNAIAGSRLEDDDETPQVSTFNFPSVISEILSGFSLGILDRIFAKHKVVREIATDNERVDWVAGASFMLPKPVVDRVGLMDDDYFLYFEEVDYCLAIQKAGFDCWYVPASRVVHEVGASTGISDIRKTQPRRPQYWFESRQRYFKKNHGAFALLLADVGWALGYSSWLLRKKLTGGQKDINAQPPFLLRDFVKQSQFNLFK